MKKVLLFFGLVIFSLTTAHAQQISESFEGGVFPPAGWKAVTVLGENQWQQSSTRQRSGNFSALVRWEQLANGYMGSGEHWLITPKVANIKSTDKITFYISSDAIASNYPIDRNQKGYFDSLEVHVSTTGNNPADFTTMVAAISLDSQKLAENFIKYEFNFPASVHGQSAYIGFRHMENEGLGLYIDDVTAGTKVANDAMLKSINLTKREIFLVNRPINIEATVLNNGTETLPAGIPVSYIIDGSFRHTVNTSVPIGAGAATQVSFTGGNAFIPTEPGTFELKVFFDLAGDENTSNDTMVYTIKVQEPLSIFPYFMNFDEPSGWSNAGNYDFEFVKMNTVYFSPIISPGDSATTVAFANTFMKEVAGDSFSLRTPLLDFTNTTKPMLNFYVSSENVTDIVDSLLIVVSTDGGKTYGAPLYTKSGNTSSNLITSYSDETFAFLAYFPDSASNWRHEIVDLSAYAGNPNVMVIFKLIGLRGNNVFIDNVKILDQPVDTYSETMVTAPGVITGTLNTKINFHTVPAPDYVRIQGHNQYPDHMYDLLDRFKEGFAATSNNGDTIKPNQVKNRYVTIAYSGNTDVRALYDISLDMTGLPIEDPDKYVIVKRSDEEERWIPLNTTRSGNVLTATGLDRFSDFAIGYFDMAVPVTIVDFTGKADGNTIRLAWRTAQEVNIASYDVQKWSGSTWVSIGNRLSLQGSMENNYTLIDGAPQQGANLYRLKINGDGGPTKYSEVVRVMWSLSANKVYQNVPNPLKDYTIIRYDLSRSAKVKIVIYDTRGTQIGIIENAQKDSGTHQVRWDASGLPSGTYFYSVIIDGEVTSKSMMKIK